MQHILCKCNGQLQRSILTEYFEGDESVRRAERPSEERLLDDERRQARDDQISQPGDDDDDDGQVHFRR